MGVFPLDILADFYADWSEFYGASTSDRMINDVLSVYPDTYDFFAAIRILCDYANHVV